MGEEGRGGNAAVAREGVVGVGALASALPPAAAAARPAGHRPMSNSVREPERIRRLRSPCLAASKEINLVRLGLISELA